MGGGGSGVSDFFTMNPHLKYKLKSGGGGLRWWRGDGGSGLE